MKIVYMGTPEFACPCLQCLIDSRHEVAAVITQPDKPSGRGKRMTPPPIKVLAENNGIRVFQPQSLKKGEDAEKIFNVLSEISPDVIVVAAYGKLLGENILSLPKYGCINVHASLLPKYRGAAPIQWSVINGEKKTGVTIMKMEMGLDTGDMLKKAETTIGENETASELHDRLKLMGAPILLEVLDELEKGTASSEKQKDSEHTYAPMLSREMSGIDFSKSAKEVHNLIRGLSDWPCAQFYFGEKRIKVYKSELVEKSFDGADGELVDEKQLIIRCGDGFGVKITELQQDGSKRMNAKAFLCGNKPQRGIIAN